MRTIAKKLSALLLCLLLIFSITACFNPPSTSKDSDTSPKSGDPVTINDLSISHEVTTFPYNILLRIRPKKDITGLVLIIEFYGYFVEKDNYIFLKTQIFEVGDILYGEEYFFDIPFTLDRDKIFEQWTGFSHVSYEIKSGTLS